MALGPAPAPGQDTDTLWRYVKELYDHVRALENMRLSGQLSTIGIVVQGKLEVNNSESVLKFIA